MTIELAPSWELTTDSTLSHYGLPVLRHRVAGGSDYGPADIVTAIPSFGMVSAAHVACRLAHGRPAALAATRRFCAQWPDGPQP